MVELTFLDNSITNALLHRQELEKTTRPKTGKLTGSMLYVSCLEQVLEMLGVPQKPFDAYTLRKFERGHQVEDWIVSNTIGKMETMEVIDWAITKGLRGVVGVADNQVSIVYRGCTGHLDLVVDMAEWKLPEYGVIPHEIKSITNADWNRTFGGKMYRPADAKPHHKWQIGMYAMALKVPHYAVTYVASDDFRTKTMLFETKDVRREVDTIITDVYTQLGKHTLPAFSPRVEWMNNPLYQRYPDWAILSGTDAMAKLKKEYPKAYAQLQSWKEEGGE